MNRTPYRRRDPRTARRMLQAALGLTLGLTFLARSAAAERPSRSPPARSVWRWRWPHLAYLQGATRRHGLPGGPAADFLLARRARGPSVPSVWPAS
jgi:hypothetical protein